MALKDSSKSSWWLIVLALGLGVAIGVGIAVGLSFEKSDSARFIGSMLGSIIAISGAVSLHYLKEADDKRKMRKHLSALLKVAIHFSPLAAKDIREKNDPQDAALTFKHQFDRCVAFSEKYQFDDYAISEAFDCISESNINLLDFDNEKAADQNYLELMCQVISTTEKALRRSHASLLTADDKLKVLG